MVCDIIGGGKVGFALAGAFDRNNILRTVYCRSETSLNRINKISPSKAVIKLDTSPKPGADFYAIALPDSVIGSFAEAVSKSGHDYSRAIFFHTGGSMTKEVLKPLTRVGANIAAVHPYQTFAYFSANSLNSIAWGVDCDSQNEETIRNLVTLIEGIPVFLNSGNPDLKALYHASAVIASNCVSVMIGMAKNICRETGLPAETLLPPIIRQTVENSISELGTPNLPVTGPISRGDVETIEKHLKSMQALPEIRKAYISASLSACEVCKRNGIIDQRTYNNLFKLLKTGEEDENTHR